MLKHIKKFSDFSKTIINESFSNDSIMDVIINGGYITAKYVLNYENHNESDELSPVDIDDDGNIAVIINGQIYYTKSEWVTSHKIAEVSENVDYISIPDPVKNGRDIKMDNSNKDKVDDPDFQQLLKDQGGVSGVIRMLKKHKGVDYSSMKNAKESELYLRLKEDGLLEF